VQCLSLGNSIYEELNYFASNKIDAMFKYGEESPIKCELKTQIIKQINYKDNIEE
jgi:hypothetical protein